jgi:hypothetical protein
MNLGGVISIGGSECYTVYRSFWMLFVCVLPLRYRLVHQERHMHVSYSHLPIYRSCFMFMYNSTGRKVAGSVPDCVIGIFHWHNPSDRSMALGWTQPLTEMSTRNISWGWRRTVLKAGNLTTFMCRLSWILGTSTSWNPLGMFWPLMGLLQLTTRQNYNLLYKRRHFDGLNNFMIRINFYVCDRKDCFRFMAKM